MILKKTPFIYFFLINIVAVKDVGLSKISFFPQGQPLTKKIAVEAVQHYKPIWEDLLRACPLSWQCFTCSKHITSPPSKDVAECFSGRWNTTLLSHSPSAKAPEGLRVAVWLRFSPPGTARAVRVSRGPCALPGRNRSARSPAGHTRLIGVGRTALLSPSSLPEPALTPPPSSCVLKTVAAKAFLRVLRLNPFSRTILKRGSDPGLFSVKYPSCQATDFQGFLLKLFHFVQSD